MLSLNMTLTTKVKEAVEKSHNKAGSDLNFGRHEDLSTFKSDIHLGLAASVNISFSSRSILMSIWLKPEIANLATATGKHSKPRSGFIQIDSHVYLIEVNNFIMLDSQPHLKFVYVCFKSDLTHAFLKSGIIHILEDETILYCRFGFKTDEQNGGNSRNY